MLQDVAVAVEVGLVAAVLLFVRDVTGYVSWGGSNRHCFSVGKSGGKCRRAPETNSLVHKPQIQEHQKET